jgi:iron complex outermembrane receptor protein
VLRHNQKPGWGKLLSLRRTLGRKAIAAAAIALALGNGAHAAVTADGVADGGDIVVTAQSRTETARSTPIAVTVLTGDFVERTRLRDIKDVVAFTPGFSGNSADSYIDSIAIRGIVSNDYGIGGDPSIGIFKNGVYQGRSGGAVTSLYDIDRAEALRGPQGFLFGRNAISGAISVTTAKPKLNETSADVRVSYSSHDRQEYEGAINMPLGDLWAVRLAAWHTSYDGWVDNLFTPQNDKLMGGNVSAARGSLLYDDGAFRFTLTAEHERRRLDGTPYRASNADREVIDALDAALGTHLVIRGGPREVDSDLTDPRDDSNISNVTARADLDAGFATLTSITGFRHYRFFYSEDYDGTPLMLDNDSQQQRGSYLSQEFRLVSPDSGRLTWLAGVSGYREKVRTRFVDSASEQAVCAAVYGYPDCDALTQDLFGRRYVPTSDGLLVDTNDVRSTNMGLSFYGDANVRLLSQLTVGAGLRYSYDHKHFGLNVLPTPGSLGNIFTFTYFTTGFVEGSRGWGGFTPRLYARFAANADLNIYASITRGYKAGGFGSFTVNPPTPLVDYALVPAGTRPDVFAPETVWSKEIGVKGALLDGRVQFDLTGFHYVYSDLQSVYFDPQTRTQRVTNIGKVHGFGVEAGMTIRPSRYFDLYGNATWTRTRKNGDRGCTAQDCGGLPNPAWASSGVATVHLPLRAGEYALRGEWIYEGRRRESFDWRGITRRNATTQVNLSLGYDAAAGWGINAHIRNLFDSIGYHGAENGGGVNPATVWGVSEPRNFGMDLRWSFRR